MSDKFKRGMLFAFCGVSGVAAILVLFLGKDKIGGSPISPGFLVKTSMASILFERAKSAIVMYMRTYYQPLLFRSMPLEGKLLCDV